ncbi:MAG TPA: hypothetical protein VLR26_04100 [Frankiaceae bacterium]|nr:hypothetical protein [Frankiaceae bacterium]
MSQIPPLVLPLTSTDRACCCPATPSLQVLVCPGRGSAALLLCRHHWHRHAAALLAGGAAVYDHDGSPLAIPDQRPELQVISSTHLAAR